MPPDYRVYPQKDQIRKEIKMALDLQKMREKLEASRNGGQKKENNTNGDHKKEIKQSAFCQLKMATRSKSFIFTIM